MDKLFKTRFSRKRHDTLKQYHAYLITLRNYHDCGYKVSAAKIASQMHISRMAAAWLPDDLYTIPYEQLTLDYTARWRDEKLQPKRRESMQKQQQPETLPVVEESTDTESGSIPDIVQEMAQLVENFAAEWEAFKTKINYKTLN